MRHASYLTFLALSLAPSIALAETEPAPVHTEIRLSGRDTPLWVYGPRRTLHQDDVKYCRGSCYLDLVPGEYRLQVGSTDDYVGGTDDVDITAASLVTVRPRTVTSHTAGAVFAIVGAALLVGGGVVLGLSKPSSGHDDGACVCPEGGQVAGLLMGAGSIPLFLIGAALGTRTSPDVDVEPAPTKTSAWTPTVRTWEWGMGMTF
jgi:hypothetical protein